MTHNNTLFSQILKRVPRHEFKALANRHHEGRRFRRASCWSPLVTMAMVQLARRSSRRGIVENMTGQAYRLYHLGNAKLPRVNLSRINPRVSA